MAGSSGQTSGGPLNYPAMFVSFNLLGSVVLEINGIPLMGSADVAKAFTKHKKGDVVTAKILRRAKELELTTKR